jgi:hypothetical protein
LFGIVAIEAMACGTPVVASAVGGLRHVVLPQKTGFLFEAGDSASLAWILMAMIINKDIHRLLSPQALRWSRLAFSQNTIITRMLQAYSENELAPHPMERPEIFFREEISQILLQHGVNPQAEVLVARHNVIVRNSDGHTVTKIFTNSSSSDFSNFVIKEPLTCCDAQVCLSRSQFNCGNKHAVQLINTTNLTASYPYLLKHSDLTNQAAFDFSKRFSSAVNPPSQQTISGFRRAWDRLWENRDMASLTEFDQQSALVNEVINGRANVFTRTDPRAEIIRYQIHISRPFWPLSPTNSRIFFNIFEDALAEAPNKVGQLEYCHGDFLPRHILTDRGSPVLCDLDESSYKVGPFDITHYLFRDCLNIECTSDHVRSAVNNLHALIEPSAGRKLAILWAMVQLTYISIRRARRGDSSSLDSLPSWLQVMR